MLLVTSLAGSLRSTWRRSGGAERAAYAIGGLLLLSGLIHLAILGTTGASWEGPLSLRKAMTFGLSFGLTLITLSWVASVVQLRRGARAALLGVLAATSLLETTLVSIQAWRGVPSHFNLETPFDGMVSRTLAAGGAALIAIVAILTIVAFRASPAIPAGRRAAIRVGLAALCVAMITGAIMIAHGMALVFAGNPQTAYVAAGTLKRTHAVAMHGVLVLPAAAWLLSLTSWSEQRQVRLVYLAAACYAACLAVVAAIDFAAL